MAKRDVLGYVLRFTRAGGYDLDFGVAEHIARKVGHLPRRDVDGCVIRLIAYASMTNQDITAALADDILERIVEEDPQPCGQTYPVTSLDDIQWDIFEAVSGVRGHVSTGCCDAEAPEGPCTRQYGHAGDHVAAHTDGRVLARWRAR